MQPTSVFYVRTDDVEEDERIALAALQGLANRGAPRLFLIHGAADEHWLHWYASYGFAPEKRAFDEALQALGDCLKGAVVWDEKLRDTIPLSLSIAGARDVLPLSARLAERLNLPVVEDLRGRWQDRVAAYRWAHEQVWPNCSRDILGSFGVRDEPGSFSNLVCDLLVARRGFASSLAVSTDLPDEAALCERFMSETNDLALAVGWHTHRDIEATYVDACSRHGMIQICSSGGSNMSFHQHVAAQQLLKQDHFDEAGIELRKAVYVTFNQTDGDALHSMCNLQQGQWGSPLRGSIPMGWWIAPKLAHDLGPALLEYYYRTRTANDYLVAGPSGAGYNYPSVMPNLDEYLRTTAEYMKLTNTRAIHVINRVVKRVPGDKVLHRTAAGDIPLSIEDGGLNEELKNTYGADYLDDDVAENYARALPGCIGFFQGFETVVGEEDRFPAGAPWIPTKVMVDSPAQGLRDIERFLEGRSLPAFVSATINMCGPMNRSMFEKLTELARELRARGHLIVRPDEFLIACRKAHS
ncbi:MAG: hypothetical protein JSV65_13165 [Armatimonadota bacterium]|nr:MAG: hypothetical protein JSV65_13165 [Armatimonadota bacterium]